MLDLYAKRVAVIRSTSDYSHSPPYHPSEEFPEWLGGPVSADQNPAYSSIRQVFRALGMDPTNYGTPEWSPLAGLIRPGGKVVIKPNLVTDRNSRSGSRGQADFDCLVTHGSVVRAVLDYAALAMDGTGSITIADCPIQGCDWEALTRRTGLDDVIQDARKRWPEINLELCDFRLRKMTGYQCEEYPNVSLSEVPEGYEHLDLGSRSLLVPLMQAGVEFGVSKYPRERMRQAHTPTVNRYLVPNRILEADLFINLPKIKVHQKAGLTGALKNLVGINGHKDYLPHFRFGSPSAMGDEYPDGGPLWNLRWTCSHHSWDAESAIGRRIWSSLGDALQISSQKLGLVEKSEFLLGSGSWHANDTLWRTVLDINRAFFYYNRETKQVEEGLGCRTNYITISDGLVGGDTEGPLAPRPVKSGLMLGGFNPVAVDFVQAAVMGFEPLLIPQLREAIHLADLPLCKFNPRDIEVCGDLPSSSLDAVYEESLVAFKPSAGWCGTVEFREKIPE